MGAGVGVHRVQVKVQALAQAQSGWKSWSVEVSVRVDLGDVSMVGFRSGVRVKGRAGVKVGLER